MNSTNGSGPSETPESKPVPKRKNTLQKHKGKMLATTIFATSLFLTACGDPDCYTFYRSAVNTPGSSGFTSSSQLPKPQTYCLQSNSTYYGTSYIYAGSSS